MREKLQPLLFLLIAAVVLSGLILITGRESQMPETTFVPMEDTTVAVATDLHYIAPTLTDGGEYFTRVVTNADGKVSLYSEELTEAFVQQIIAEHPAALILSGDLTFNGARESHLRLAEKLRRVQDSGVRVLVIPGNHDLYSTMAASFHGDSFTRVESITSDEFADVYASFGYADALARDEVSASYVAELAPGLRILLVDVNTKDLPGGVKDETLAWIERQLAQAQEDGARVVAVSHQTLLQHNSLFAEGFVITNRERLHALYTKYDVGCNLSGHMHIQHIAASGGVTEIVTSALSVAPNQYGVLTLAEAGGDYRTKPVDVSAWARQQGSTDENLLAFADYAAAFFAQNSFRQSVTDDSDAIAYLTELNLAYFSGRMDTVKRDEAVLQTFEMGDPFTGAYVQSVAEDIGRDSTRTTFPFSGQ